MKEKKNIDNKKLITYILAAILIALALFFGSIAIFAEEGEQANQTDSTSYQAYGEKEESGETNTTEKPKEGQSRESAGEGKAEEGKIIENPENSDSLDSFDDTDEKNIIYSENIFEDIYRLLEQNADKIFSILAFIGTIVVGVGYKSGLLPLLRDAISKLKGSIDKVGEVSNTNNRDTGEKITEIGSSIEEISQTLAKNAEEIARIEWQFESYEQVCREREAMRVIMQNQIDMLYAIFISSALPQYQKEEIGTKIAEMREVLDSYGIKEK